MTKQRAPLTFEQALTRVAGRIGWAEAAGIAGQAERTVRNWSDPDTSAAITLEKALLLDLAYLLAGGDVAPFLCCYATRLDVETVQCVDFTRDALARAAAVAATESGEALAAFFHAARTGSQADLLIGERQCAEAIDALTNMLVYLRTGRGSDHGPGVAAPGSAPLPGGAV